MQRILAAYADHYLRPCLSDILNGSPLGGVLPASFAFFAASLYQLLEEPAAGRCLVIATPSNQEAETLAGESLLYLEPDAVAYFPGYENIPYEYSSSSADIALQRIRVLSRVAGGERLLVFTGADAVSRKMPHPDRLSRLSRRLRVDDEIPPRELLRSLVDMGYQREERVEAPGQFALKGSVLDVYPVNGDQPVRIEYFDDYIESIRYFSANTQLGADRTPECEILPAGEVVLDGDESARLRTALQKYAKDLDRPAFLHEAAADTAYSQFHHAGLQELFPLVADSTDVFAAFPEAPVVLSYPANEVNEAAARIRREFLTLYRREHEQRICLEPETLLVPFPGERTITPLYRLSKPIEDAGATDESEDDAVDAVDDEDAGHDPDESTDERVAVSSTLGVREVIGFGGRIAEVREKIRGLLVDEQAVVCISSPYAAQMRRIAGLFRHEQDIEIRMIGDTEETAGAGPILLGNTAGKKKKSAKKKALPALHILRSSHQQGFEIPELKFYLLTDSEIFGRSYRRRTRFKKLGTVPIESFLDLKEGDYVVHVNHGVGRFEKLEKVRAAGRERDFLVLEYADKDKLFVPLDQISMVQRYIAPTEKPRLDSLGKASFKKVRERVEQKIEEFAGELVRLYALRMSRKGYAYPADTAWQEEFEADFPFEETPDQITAIEAVKRDMEAPQPMDRLICGDVGYGKTEVAIRATFKAVMAGRQVAIIAPTTILALQHYHNFRERYKNYPVSVDWISRFRSRAETKEIKQKLLHGELDVVVGTHGLLSKDIHIRNLGLLVVDEEQRFGVTHKEAIKRMRELVDVLTLSATPIPRTLHMSLVGIRDLSIIQTPPRDRLPVQTYVIDDNDTIIEEAIARELERDGQIFYLHNRIESIEGVADRVQNLLPEVRLAVLHGRMLEEEIEDVLLQFMERKFDVLITTAIIENGIDMPNVNTLIVDRADTFGLSQLYQIRGRVGRAGRQAYAYLLHSSGRILTETAQKRLNTILEYQELGSGFKVAMRDLEIRGAGNVLGKEQSGQIMEVGYELYVKLLEEAVQRLKGEAVESEVRTTVNLRTDFFLPDDYIPDTRQRIEFYKRFEAARDEDEVLALRQEMSDRFGRLPEAAEIFARVETVRALASCTGFEEVYEDDEGRVRMRAGEHLNVPPEHIVQCIKQTPNLRIMPGQPNVLYVEAAGEANSRAGMPLGPKAQEVPVSKRLDEIIGVLRRLAEPAIMRRRRARDGSEGKVTGKPQAAGQRRSD